MITGVLVIAGVLVVAFLTLGDKTGDDAPGAVVKLTSDEVAALLGLKEKAGIKIGDIESGRDGVKVQSISLKNNESTEVEIHDIELRITSTSKLVYVLSSLRIGKLDILDWQTTQRAQAFGVLVDKPGDGFLSQLQATMTSVSSGGPLKIAVVSCARLGIERIDYLIRSKDATVTRVSIEALSMTEATSETLGELSVRRISMGDTVAGKGLKLTKADRLWADQLLAVLVTLPGADHAATLRSVAASFQSPALEKRLLPFDRFEVAEMNFIVSKSRDLGSKVVKVTDVRLDVQRRSDGQWAGIHGTVNVSIPTTVFEKDMGLAFVRAMGNPKLEESLAFSAQMQIVLDHSPNQERSEISISAPGLAAISGTATTRGLPELLNMLIAQQELPKNLTLSSLKLEGRDDGLVVFLLSDRHKDREGINTLLEIVPNLWPDGVERGRLSSEIKSFRASPGRIIFTAESGNFIAAEEFLDEILSKPGQSAAISSRLSFVSKLDDRVSPSPSRRESQPQRQGSANMDGSVLPPAPTLPPSPRPPVVEQAPQQALEPARREAAKRVPTASVGIPNITRGDTYITEYQDPDNIKPSYRTVRKVLSVGEGKITIASKNVNDKTGKERTLQFTSEWNLMSSRSPDGNGMDYSPPLKYFDFPLFPGKTWRQTSRGTNIQTYAVRDHTVSAVVGDWEDIIVPTGKLRAIKITLHTELIDLSTGQKSTETDISWYAPEIRRSAKSEIIAQDFQGRQERRFIQLIHHDLK